jgi:hypothetical protein
MISTTPSLNKLSNPEYEAGKKRFCAEAKEKGMRLAHAF